MDSIKRMKDKYDNILGLIGNTPLVEIRRLRPNNKVRIYAKLESCNPGGSVKDRVALFMIEGAESRGELRGKTILEATSGNTGIGLAMVAAVKGYPITLAMSESASMERRKILKAYGAELLLTPARLSTDGAIEEVYRLAREQPEKYYVPDQFNNEDNIRAHYEGTGVEIWEQTQGAVTHFVASLGTSGTLMGASRRLKEYNPQIRILGVEPYLGHKIQGLKNMKESYKPGIFDKTRLDAVVNIEDEEAFETARRLVREEGLLVGMSAGASMALAYRTAQELEEGLIVVLFPDSGERYLSTALFQDRKKSPIRFFNTLTRDKEDFIPLQEGKVTIYSCGPTAHGFMNLGTCRRIVFADVLRRHLEYRGFEVTHVMNITDIDDKTIDGSGRAGKELKDYTREHIAEILRDIDTLEVKRAEHYPVPSECIEEMFQLTQRLLDKGVAYEKFRSVYFDISRFEHYGNLSRVDLSKIHVGKTVDLDEYEKDNPRDFTLLKRSTLAELKRGIFYKTPWGNVRPGWHLQCAAMSTKYLGDTIDIHTSGTDLIFPHHENEIAIVEALTGKRFANYWLHCELVLLEGRKMSRSAEGMVTLRELIERGYSGREVRYWLLTQHHHKPLNYSDESLLAARNALQRLDEFVLRLTFAKPGPGAKETPQLLYELKSRFNQAMDDDLNVPAALASIFTFARKVNPLISRNELRAERMSEALELLRSFNSVLMIMEFPSVRLTEEEELLMDRREAARARRNWTEADQLRDALMELGVKLIDGPEGTRWYRVDRESRD
jgi:cysteinyl-tRNA synthetase